MLNDHPPGFQSPRCNPKATHGNCNVHTKVLPTDLQNQDQRTSLSPEEAQVADDTNDGHIVAAAAQNVAEKKKNTKRSGIHFQETPIRSTEFKKRSVTDGQTS